MSVVAFEELYRDEASVSREDAEVVRYFLARTNRVTDTIETLLIARPDLAPYQPHPQHKGLFVERFRAERIEGTLAWDVTVSYAPVEGQRRPVSPLEQPAKITLASSAFTAYTLTDWRGRPRRNTAGELLDPAERDDSRFVLNVSKNVQHVPKWLLEYNNVVNSDTVAIRGLEFPPKTLLFKDLSVSDIQWDAATRTAYLVLSFALHYSRRGWLDRPLNVGLHEKTEKGLVDIYAPGPGTTGERITEPVFLDRGGRAFRDEKGRLRPPKEKEIVVLKFELYPPKPFSILPLT